MHTITTEARRAQIVQAAIEIIAELGYGKASFARITERAGLSSPRMISYHFANKEDLLHQIAADIYTIAAQRLVERVEVHERVEDKLAAYLEANVDFIRTHPREVIVLTEIGPHLRDEDGKPFTSSSSQEGDVQVLESLLRQGQERGEFREFDTRSMAILIRGAITAAVQRIHSEPALDHDAYKRELLTTCALATRRA